MDTPNNHMTHTSRQDVLDAAKSLQYAIRWFFHMWVTFFTGSGTRWDYGYWRGKIIVRWEDYREHPWISPHKSLEDSYFIGNIIGGTEFLTHQWFGFRLSRVQKWLLKRLLGSV